MAKAGYDPHGALDLWDVMAAVESVVPLVVKTLLSLIISCNDNTEKMLPLRVKRSQSKIE